MKGWDMTDINSVDLKEYVNNAMTVVFDTMLSMNVEQVNADINELGDGQHVVGTVSFAGDVMGNVNIHVNQIFANKMAAAMLGMEEDEIETDEEVHDVLGEVCNMVGGDIKSRLCDAGLPCDLSIPTITVGNDFNIESKGWARSEKYGFRTEQNTAYVEIYVKPSS